MFSLKTRLAVLSVLVVCFGLGISLFAAPPVVNQIPGEGDRLLSDREMAATFGDAPGNSNCRMGATCIATRVGAVNGGPACIRCKDGMGTIWIICCPTADATKACLMNTGTFSCKDLDEESVNSFQQQTDCVFNCIANGGVVWTKTGFKCTTRQDGQGNQC